MRRVQTALAQTVYEAALERTRFVFDNCDDVVVSMSGGKDSTVLLHLAVTVAAQLDRLPVKVMWLDQEAEWQATVDFMRHTFGRPDVAPYWFQVPFRLTNSLSGAAEWLYCWDPRQREKWLHPQEPGAITQVPLPYNRFHDVIKWLATCCDTADRQHCGVLVGMRMAESIQRRIQLGHSRSGSAPGARKTNFKGITWAAKPVANTRIFWPIHDWQDQDVWVCIARNNLDYNAVYDALFRYGVSARNMRVSALIHENAWNSILQLQEIEPATYGRFLARVQGTSAFAHFTRREIMPTELPTAFASWREYRDYLLLHLIEPRYQEAFRKRWARPSLNTVDPDDPDRWYKVHVKEVMINDWEGTLSDKQRASIKLKDRKASGYYGGAA